jgi:excinuclease ABC subunit A
MHDIIYENAQSRLHRRGNAAEELQYCDEFTGTEYLGRTVMIDQSPIGRTSRSNPATYTGVWGPVRELFASTKEARVRGWGKGRFSFNTEGGRCESCSGKGEIKVEMHFLPTVYVTCDVCQGKRFTEETLEATYNGKNIYDILQMTVEEAKEFFEDIPKIHDRLETLDNVGLSYLKLGQPSTTLSGGEAQRVKISSELYRRHTKKTLYLLDEPTVGLHYEDIKKLINILQMLVDKGNTVMVIEHNMDVIKSADYIIDMGPKGGKEGGKIVTTGTPEQVATADTATGEFLENHVEPED